MNKEDLCFISACDMATAIKRGDITSLELIEVMIERIERINPVVNAYCTLTFDLARETAKKIDNKVKNGEDIGPLMGVPVSIKDLMLTKGIRTTFGSKIYENYIPDKDEIAVKRLKNAGCVILGKTNTPEFGYAGVTHNLIFGETKNPWNLERTCGGSSGGAAVAVACGLGPLALGSDGGGSIRHPSTLCGVYGLKPNYGRIPIYPTIGLAGHTITHYGPIVNYVKDAALMLDVLKGPHNADKDSLPNEKISYFKNIDNKPKKLRIGYSINLGYAKVIDPEVEKCILNSVQKFEELDWTIEDSKLKIKRPVLAFNTIYTAMYAYDLYSKLKKWREKIDPDLIKLIEAGATYPASAYLKAIAQRKRLYHSIYKYFKEFDILITPTVAIPAFKLGIMYPSEINGVGVSPTGWQPFTFPFNLTGNPAATIPAGWSADGLPIGMQIVGKRFDELTVLQVSKAFEEIAPWQNKRPNLD
ncbi:MAG: amidase [Promethearchaeota archaeon]